MKYPHFKIIDFRPGELIGRHWVCSPSVEYSMDENVAWLEDETGNVHILETIVRRRPFAPNAVIESDDVLFKAAISNGSLNIIESRCEWLRRNW